MSSKTPDEFKELGNQAFAKKDYEEAIKHYGDAIKSDRTNHVFFSNRSASYGGLQKWQLAADDAKECIRLDPTFIKGYYRLATAQIELKNYDGAMATVRQGLTTEPNNSQLLKQMRTIKQLQNAVARQQSKALATTVGGASLDAAAASELQDLKVQYAQSSRELNLVQVNLNKAQREYRVSELTKSELEEVPEEANCYRSIGKMFLLSSKKGVIEHLDEQMEKQTKLQADMTKKVEYLEKRIGSQRQNIEELIASHSTAA